MNYTMTVAQQASKVTSSKTSNLAVHKDFQSNIGERGKQIFITRSKDSDNI
ncbi:hypothetical protein [Lysinibacillus fusiformis]